MLEPESDFNEYIQMHSSSCQKELKCMKEEYYSTRPSKRSAIIMTYIQRNEKLGRELDTL